MAEDTEKRFHNVMEKLFHSPKSNLSPSSGRPSSVQNMRGQKRPNSTMDLSSKGEKGEGVPNASQAPPCRPWDREDLRRRLTTFKSMTWFAKPKVMDPVNCARRGWVNIDMDIIACEVCGARLQFSTPSTWSHEQIEKAARVFSLKLDNGHKLLCPWIDNACGENLALFPPMPAQLLVDQYKGRCSCLLRLSALPVISASVLESMGSPQLEHFLKQSITLENGAGTDGISWSEYLGDDFAAFSDDLYYQAYRLLSLCGWEPRLLPYIVYCSEQEKQTNRGSDICNLSYVAAGERNNKMSVYVSPSGDNLKASEVPLAYDPCSTALDCRLCGASVGLWAFATNPRPLELIRVVGQTEIDGGGNNRSKNSELESQSVNGNNDFSTVDKETTMSREKALNLTIAGGPPPTKLNFRPTISLPVIGHNVRACFSYKASHMHSSSKEGHASHNAFTDAPTESMLHKSSSGELQHNVGVSNGDNVQNEASSSVPDVSPSLQWNSTDDAELRKDTSCVPHGGEKKNGGGDIVNPVSEKYFSPSSVGLWRHPSDKKLEFHPITEHRYFCPWVVSTETKASGWQQTLSALLKERVFSLPKSKDYSSSPSLIEVDDPITSIRKLFESPLSKRLKPAST